MESEEEEDVKTASSEDEEDGEAAIGGVVGGVVTTDTDYVPSRLDDVARHRWSCHSRKGATGGLMKTPCS